MPPVLSGFCRRIALLSLLVLPMAQPAVAQDDRAEIRPVAASLRPDAAGTGLGVRASTLPRLLHRADQARYRRIFTLQKDGHWRRADAEIRRLGNRMLLGHVLAQRYLHPNKYRSRYRELKRWLDRYADHPDARRIWRLAMRRKARSVRPLPRPVVRRALRASGSFSSNDIRRDYSYVSKRRRSAETSRKARRLIRKVRRHAARGGLTRSRRLLSRRSTQRLLDATEMGIARSYLAAGYFFRGSNAEAYRLSTNAARRAGRYMPLANWIAGLSAYREGRYAEAGTRFAAMADGTGLSSWTASAAAFWAARSHLVSGQPAQVSGWLRKAAVHEHTFYGLLAARVLGVENKFDWTTPRMTARRVGIIARDPAGRRALALLQIGDYHRAERELVGLATTRDSALGEALLAVAETSGLATLALRAGAIVVDDTGATPKSALYPVPQWQPDGGFTMDRAVIYAFMRQESRFNARATSRAGARGLMQLMPATAGFMVGKPFRGHNRRLLYEPELNIAIAQRYMRYLIKHDQVNGDMLLLATAYNGGPGNLAKWRRGAKRRNALDPLLFIESIPARETRNYVERVLANLWLYRSRLGQSSPSLDRLAAGRAPFYKSLDGDDSQLAYNERH